MNASTYEKVVLVVSSQGGQEISTFKTRLQMVTWLIDNGVISETTSYYGSAEHVAALHAIENQILSTLGKIAQQEREGKP